VKTLFLPLLLAATAFADTTEDPLDFIISRKNSGSGYTTFFIPQGNSTVWTTDSSGVPVATPLAWFQPALTLASQVEAEAGVENTHYMTPLRVKQAITALGGGGGGGGGTWGSITGTLSDQTDLNVALSGKVPTTRTVNGYALSSNITLAKSDIGLANVENTAISTWAGSTALTTVGTISSGTWNGSAIGDTYISSATTWNSKQAGDSDLTSWAALTRTSGFDTFATAATSANLRSLLTDEVGTGAAYFVGGALGTPASGTLTNATGLPVSTGISGLGTGIATALAANTGSAGAPVLFNGALGTPSSGTLTNATGLPVGGISATGTPSSTTYLRGDGTWSTPSGSGSVSISGTPTNGQIAAWTNSTTIQGTSSPNIGTATGTSLSMTGFNTTSSQLRTGGLEFQSYSLGNAWIGENLYFDGSNFTYRSTGAGGLFYFQGTEGQFRFAASGTGGTAATMRLPLKINYDGTVAMGGTTMSNTGADYSNATFVANASGVRMIGGTPPASASASGTAGDIRWDSSYIYVCTATNTWKRTAISTW